MKALIWKEVREMAVPVGIVLCMYLVIVAMDVQCGSWRDPGDGDGPRFLLFLLGMPVLGLIAGCYALARERQWHTSEWLSSLAIRRGQVWMAKLSVSLVVLAALYAIALGVVVGGLYAAGEGHRAAEFFEGDALWAHLGRVFSLFALGFILSGIRRTPLEALAMGVLAWLVWTMTWHSLSIDVLARF